MKSSWQHAADSGQTIEGGEKTLLGTMHEAQWDDAEMGRKGETVFIGQRAE
jgi:hypothetical protein